MRMKTASFIVCDKCGNDSWYIVGPNPHGKTPLCQVQICAKCGFALILRYELVSATRMQISDLEALLAEIGETTGELPIDGPQGGGRLYDATIEDIGIHKR